MDPIQALRERLGEIQRDTDSIREARDANKRDFTETERESLKRNFAEQDRLTEEIELLEGVEARREALAAPQPRKAAPNPIFKGVGSPQEDEGGGTAVATLPERRTQNLAGRPYATAKPSSKDGGFRSLGEFAQAVRLAVPGNPGEWDGRLKNLAAVTTYSGESVGSDGGFVVPPDFRDGIVQLIFGEQSLLSLCNQFETARNSVSMPCDESTPWASTGGIQVYWTGEAAAYTQSKVAVQERKVVLHKLTALVPVTEELLEDGPALTSYLRTAVPDRMIQKINNAIIFGTGAGQPLGLKDSTALVSVAKETSQTADTVVYANLTKMWARMYAPYRSDPRTVWIISQDVEGSLLQMQSADGHPVYMAGGNNMFPNAAAAPFIPLLGKRVFVTQACETLGDKGDIYFAAMGQYLAGVKAGGIRESMSIHLWFDQDITAFKWNFRLGGMPWLSAPITQRDGAITLSAFVTLDERA